jgi:hypothetical protein
MLAAGVIAGFPIPPLSLHRVERFDTKVCPHCSSASPRQVTNRGSRRSAAAQTEHLQPAIQRRRTWSTAIRYRPSSLARVFIGSSAGSRGNSQTAAARASRPLVKLLRRTEEVRGPRTDLTNRVSVAGKAMDKNRRRNLLPSRSRALNARSTRKNLQRVKYIGSREHPPSVGGFYACRQHALANSRIENKDLTFVFPVEVRHHRSVEFGHKIEASRTRMSPRRENFSSHHFHPSGKVG